MTPRGGLLRQAPRVTLLLMAGPVIAGLLGTLAPAFGWIPGGGGFTLSGFRDLAAWPGTGAAIRLSVTTGLVATVLSLAITLLIVAAIEGTKVFAVLLRLLSPLLSVPHAAAALGLAFLMAPSGWIARALSPWATGWVQPPDLLILNDPLGLALIAGLVVKEVPFLLLMVLAALPQADAPRRMTLAASLGYGRITGWLKTVLPAIYPQIRLPVFAVLAYSMTTVDMALILGPTRPPTLSVQVLNWMTHPDIAFRCLGSAAAVVQLIVVLAVIGLWRGAEIVAGPLACRWAEAGGRGLWADRTGRITASSLATLSAGAMALGLAGLFVWSIAGLWQFPDILPETVTLRTWAHAGPGLADAGITTLAIGMLATLVAVAFVLACLEAETRFNLRPTSRAMWLLYLPLIVPQVAFLPGLQVLALISGIEGTALAVASAHMVFVLPYVFLSLAAPFRAWDTRIAVAGAALGASHARIFWRLRLPMLLHAVLTATAVGFAVSVGQYLPTLLIGGGRVETLTTEAVALASGGNRRVIGTYAIMQMVLPALAFGMALALPAIVFRNRRGLGTGT